MGGEYRQTDILPESIPIQRAGTFSSLVAAAETAKLIGTETALDYLLLSNDEYDEYREIILAFAPASNEP